MVRFPPIFAIGGVLLGSLFVALFGFFAMSGVSLPSPALAAEGQPEPTQEVQLQPAPEVEAEEPVGDPIEVEVFDEDGEVPGDEVHQEVEVEAETEECAVSGNFPDSVRQWCGMITTYANKRALPPNLVAAVILQESGGDAGAYSHSGAVGLMQVMPNDGLAANFMCPAGPCFSQRPSIDELQDPEFNIAYGTRMLARLIKRKGDTREGLRSYGPMDMGYEYADRVLAIFERYSD